MKLVFINIMTNSDNDLVALCLVIDDNIFYYEFNDADYTKLSAENLDKLLFLSSNENELLYKNNELGVTYCKDNKDIILENIQNVLLQYTESDDEIMFIGNLESNPFSAFKNLLDKSELLQKKNIRDKYIDLESVGQFLIMLKLTKENIFKDLLEYSGTNLIVDTSIISKSCNQLLK